MKTHTVIGAELIADSDSPMLQLASEIALYHHERWDGSGYPTGRSGNDIPQAARIVAVVDVYDALTCDRVYRPAFPKDQVLTTLDEGSGTQFDAELLNLLFERLVEIEALAREHRDSAVPSGPSIDNPGANEFAIQRAVREPKL